MDRLATDVTLAATHVYYYHGHIRFTRITELLAVPQVQGLTSTHQSLNRHAQKGWLK